jgi:nucleoside 2-deoxyribosyltransferase
VIDLLGENNAQDIRKADGVVAVLDGVDVDSGTAAEIGYATALGKWVIGYRSDFRRTGEDETSEVNLQVEFFIRKSGGVIVHTLPELENELKKRCTK